MADRGLSALLAERAIGEQLLNYCRARDRCDIELLKSAFHSDGVLVADPPEPCGPITTCAMALIDRDRRWRVQHHNLMNPLLCVVGHEAVSETAAVIIRRAEGSAPGRWRDRHEYVRFLDRWSLRNGRWAVSRRQVIVDLAWTQDVEGGALGQRARRNRDDPVYAHLGLGSAEDADTAATAGRPPETEMEALSILKAERDIRRQLANYARGVDRFDPDTWKSVWHRDATLSYETGELDGVAHDKAFLMTFGHHLWAAHVHQSTRSAIRIRGALAASETLNMAILHGYLDAQGQSIQDHYRGRYLDRWERRDGHWAIVHRFTPRGGMWHQTVPAEVGAFMRRDRSDPSHALLGSLGRSDDDELAVLEAERAIRQQIERHSRALDRLDRSLLASLWTDDGVLRDRDEGRDGEARIQLGAWLEALSRSASRLHRIAHSLIEIVRDEAVSETYFSSLLRGHPDARGQVIDQHRRGRYLDRWTRRDGVWRLREREVVLDFAWTQSVENPPADPDSRRGGTDPADALFAGHFTVD